MKKLFLILLVLTVPFLGCKKEEGCTDKSATNYNEKAEKDDGSCTYEEEEEEEEENNNSGGGDGSSNLTNMTLYEGSVSFELSNVQMSTSGSLTTITVKKKGESSTCISLSINGGLPSTKTTYIIYDPYKNGNSCGLTINSNGKTWVAEDASAELGKAGVVTIEPDGSNSYIVYFVNAKLGDSKVSPTTTQKFNGKFTLKFYAADFRTNNSGTYKTSGTELNAVTCIDYGSYTIIEATGYNSSKTGTLSIRIPGNPGSTNYSVSTGSNYLEMTLNGQDWYAYDGVVYTVVNSSNEMYFTFSGVLVENAGGSSFNGAYGSGECILQ